MTKKLAIYELNSGKFIIARERRDDWISHDFGPGLELGEVTAAQGRDLEELPKRGIRTYASLAKARARLATLVGDDPVPRGRAGGRKPRTDAPPTSAVTVRMTADEHAALVAACAACDVSIAEAVRLLPQILPVLWRAGDPLLRGK